MTMLAQFPIFIAMYQGLSTFPYTLPAGFFWLQNLSAPDPTFILLKASAAISLYWVAGNLISLAQHYLLTPRIQTALAS